jgi:hypothetical protein
MQRVTKSVIFAAIACLIAGNCTTFAQNKSRGNGGSRNFGNARGSFSAGQQSSGNSRGTSSNTGNTISGKVLQSGGFSSNKAGGSVSRSGNTGLPSGGLRTRIGSPGLSSATSQVKIPTLKGAGDSSPNLSLLRQNSSKGSLSKLNIPSIGKETITSSNTRSSNATLPWIQKSGNRGTTTVIRTLPASSLPPSEIRCTGNIICSTCWRTTNITGVTIVQQPVIGGLSTANRLLIVTATM